MNSYRIGPAIHTIRHDRAQTAVQQQPYRRQSIRIHPKQCSSTQRLLADHIGQLVDCRACHRTSTFVVAYQAYHHTEAVSNKLIRTKTKRNIYREMKTEKEEGEGEKRERGEKKDVGTSWYHVC